MSKKYTYNELHGMAEFLQQKMTNFKGIIWNHHLQKNMDKIECLMKQVQKSIDKVRPENFESVNEKVDEYNQKIEEGIPIESLTEYKTDIEVFMIFNNEVEELLNEEVVFEFHKTKKEKLPKNFEEELDYQQTLMIKELIYKEDFPELFEDDEEKEGEEVIADAVKDWEKDAK
ncbi:hypothetical protein GCQ56_07625 [Marinifilum sp. N1E240]|uniref:hypothetical protein n=1 Tax=Marinifilum sp. N1E240 TaxID=2608082 RepID=UPI00128B59DB|nr:hypothetical protein [Marinifilum sp. N1E240]MPQ46882.1 hypothetical protein [Marinifilum sp. N1E240]